MMANESPDPAATAVDQAGSEESRLEQSVKVESIGPARKLLHIEVPSDRINEAFEANYSKLRTDATVPGFRQGRAPRRLLEKRFGRSVRDDVRGQIISESYAQAIEDENLRVLGEPEVKDLEQIELPEDGALSFEVELEVAPDVELPLLEGLDIEKTVVAVSDEDIETELGRFQQRFGTMATVADAKVQGEDFVEVDARINADDEEKAEIAHHESAFVMVPGKEQEGKGHVAGIVVDDLGKQLRGKKINDELVICTTGPSGHEDEKIRSQPIRIQLLIKAVKRMEPAPVETVASQFGVESPDDVRSQLLQMLEERAGREQQRLMHEQISDYLLGKVDLDLPEGMTGRQAQRTLQREAMELAYRGVPQQEIDQQIAERRADTEEKARRHLKLFFIIDAAAEQLEVDVTEAEINGRIAMMAMHQGRRPEKLRQHLQRSGELEFLVLQIREQKTLEAILEKAKVKEIEAKPEEKAAGAKTTRKKSTKKKAAAKTTAKTTKKKAASSKGASSKKKSK